MTAIQLNQFLRLLPPLSTEETLAFARSLQVSRFAVYRGEADGFVPIPAAIHALQVDIGFWDGLTRDANHVFSALRKVAKWLFTDPENNLRLAKIFAPLSPLELACAREGYQNHGGESPTNATIRFDLFVNGNDLSILEINATIPAMQAYSDMIANAWLHAKGISTPSDQATEIGYVSNSEQLLTSLLHRTQQHEPRVIGIVARAGDSQLGELLFLKGTWERLLERFNTKVLILTPNEIAIDHSKQTLVHRATGDVLDVTYRHIFASRLDRSDEFAQALSQPNLFRIFNPVSAHLEVKALLAELSRLADSHTTGGSSFLTPEEVRAVKRLVPWTRILDRECGLESDDIAKIHQEFDQMVFKKSHGYGGHDVLMGNELLETAAVSSNRNLQKEKLQEFFDESQRSLWVVQKRVPGQSFDNQVFYGSVAKVHAERTWFDLSLFSSSGRGFTPFGAAVRVGRHPIVNIGRGGGMMPVFIASSALGEPSGF